MSCQQPICRIVQCTNIGDLPSYLGSYSLQNGTFFANNVIVVPIPGGGFYELPADTIIIVVPPDSQVVSYQGCQTTVSVPIPSGATQSEIAGIVAQVMQQVANQQAVCDGAIVTISRSPFRNVRTSAGCDNGLEMNLVGSLPNGITFNHQGLIVAAGLFSSSSSQVAANARAQQYVNSLVFGPNPIVQCGWWNDAESFICPDSTVVNIPEGTYFSLISQDDANQQALAAAEAQCIPPCPIWTNLLSQIGPGYLFIGSGQNPSFDPNFGLSDTYDTLVGITPVPFGGDSTSALIMSDFPLLRALIVDYSASGCNCNINLTVVSSGGIPAGLDSHTIEVDVYNAGVFESTLIIVNARLFDNSTTDHPFTIPDTLGVTKQIAVFINSNLTRDSADVGAYQFSMHIVLSNV